MVAFDTLTLGGQGFTSFGDVFADGVIGVKKGSFSKRDLRVGR